MHVRNALIVFIVGAVGIASLAADPGPQTVMPMTVDMTKLVKEFPTGTGPLTPVAGAPGRFSASGVYGDATLATRAKGEKVVEATIAGILAEIEALRRAPVK